MTRLVEEHRQLPAGGCVPALALSMFVCACKYGGVMPRWRW
jgi:hypothetical protein